MNPATDKSWVAIKFDQEELVLKARIRDQEVEVIMSPYDVPEYIRSYHLTKDSRVVEFKYVSNEEEKEQFLIAPDVCYEVGKSSGRLYSFQFSESKVAEAATRQRTLKWAEIDHLIREMSERQKDEKKRRSYVLARKAVERSRAVLQTV